MSNLPTSTHLGNCLLRVGCLIAISLLLLPINLAAASGQSDDPDRKKAFQLFEEGKVEEALPLFEKLEKTYANDPAFLERFGWLLFMRNDSIKDQVARKATRKRGRDLLLRAKNAGADSPVVASMIDAVAEDGGDDSAFTFSKRKEVDDAMRAGEAAFMRKDFPKAIELYQQALILDPKMYEAALYIGDAYYSTAEQRKAAEWFARAVEIDPNRETAYRYWGDSLMKQTKVTQAGDKYVEAYIAEPYNRLANSGLGGWASKVGIELSHPKIEFPSNVTAQANGNSTISLDPNTLKKDDKSSAAWLTYSFARTSWIQGEFARQYPEEKTYRHSLKEETTSIRTALKGLNFEKDATTIDPSLVALAKLDREGLLEAYVLMAQADAGISKDFPAYRKEHVDKLREYVNKYVMTNGGKN
jgi:tetratricopeptide (TPR) repeat protein